ncbi:MAG: diguanylate cyclase, partial [Myxococcota bacterium]
MDPSAINPLEVEHFIALADQLPEPMFFIQGLQVQAINRAARLWLGKALPDRCPFALSDLLDRGDKEALQAWVAARANPAEHEIEVLEFISVQGHEPCQVEVLPIQGSNTHQWILRATRETVLSSRFVTLTHRVATLSREIARRQRIEHRLRESERHLHEANQKLQQLAITDSLTGIANRRQFDHHLHRSWWRAVRHQDPIAVLIGDIDHFKRYNDHYGHPEGDRCLVAVAEALARQARRASDLVARYGGEEFAVFMDRTTPEAVHRMAEALRSAVADLHIAHDDSPVSSVVTLSVGGALVIPTRYGSPELLVKQADQ